MNYQEFKEELQKYKELKNRKGFSYTQIFALRAKYVEEGKECAKCKRTENLTLDHIVPLSVLEQLGADVDQDLDDRNWQILCRPCNSFKANRLDFTNPNTKKILLKYINLL